MTVVTEKITLRREAGKPSIIEIPGVRDMDEVVRRLEAERAAITKELTDAGSVLVRGLPVEDAAAFGRVRDILLPRPATPCKKSSSVICLNS